MQTHCNGIFVLLTNLSKKDVPGKILGSWQERWNENQAGDLTWNTTPRLQGGEDGKGCPSCPFQYTCSCIFTHAHNPMYQFLIGWAWVRCFPLAHEIRQKEHLDHTAREAAVEESQISQRLAHKFKSHKDWWSPMCLCNQSKVCPAFTCAPWKNVWDSGISFLQKSQCIWG